MRHTLIPSQERLAIHREYHMRALAVLLAALSVAVVLGMAALFPAYLSARLADTAAAESLAFMRSNQAGNGLGRIQEELASDNALVAMLSAAAAPRFSDAIRSVVGIRSAVKLSSFSMARQGTSTIETTLGGIAPTRNDLLSFKTRLESIAPGATVDLPIEELKKSSDIQFTLRLTSHL